MQKRFRYRGNFKRNFSPPKRSNQDVVHAIIAGSGQNTQNLQQEIATYVPKHKFSDFPITAELKVNIANKGYTIPTPIQDQAIPIICAGEDIIGIANTGTGKTAAFLVPLINKVFCDKTQSVLIIAPTRELAVQIHQEFLEFARGLGLRSALCIGGANINRQRNELFQKPHFVIGTPGRLKDLIGQHCLDLSCFGNVVLDEADRMVDIGFIADIKYFISLLSPNRQSLFFSATIPPRVSEIIQTFVKNPVTVSTKESAAAAAENISQEVIRVSQGEQKVEKLHDLLIKEDFRKVLIFGRTKRGIQKLTNELTSRGFKAGVIHGDKRQNHRQKTLNEFRTNRISILLATDVASRGLDIEDVSHVINYDIPGSYDDYIHRIGRTGRANKRGVALTFVG